MGKKLFVGNLSFDTTTADLEAKLVAFRDYFNGYLCHAGLHGRPPESGVDEREKPVSLISYRWRKHCRGPDNTNGNSPVLRNDNCRLRRHRHRGAISFSILE